MHYSDLIVGLIDGRTISAPLVWFPFLSQTTPEQLANWELLGDGDGIHWPEIDEDLSVAGLLLGTHYISSKRNNKQHLLRLLGKAALTLCFSRYDMGYQLTKSKEIRCLNGKQLEHG